MRFIDLFAGIGGFREGMTRAGFTPVGWCEVDPKCDKCSKLTGKPQYTANIEHPTLKNHTVCSICGTTKKQHARIAYEEIHQPKGEWTAYDISTVDVSTLPDFDIICGGFPCQSFSIAGKRGGFKDTRGTMFFEIMRIAKAKKPKYVLLENVKGLLSHDGGKTFGTILTALGECGYNAQYQVLNSKDFGVPQNRERVFIVSNLRGEPRPEVFPFTGKNQNTFTREGELHLEGFYESAQRVYSTEGIGPTLNTASGGGQHPKIIQPVLTPDRVTKRQNGKRFKSSNESMFTITAQDRHGIAIKSATKRGYELATEGDSINFERPKSSTRRGRVGKYQAKTLDTKCKQGVVVIDKKGVKKSNQSITSCLTAGGNSGGNHSDMDLIYKIPNWIPSKSNINRTIRSSGKATLSKKHNNDFIYDDIRIRRLTPLECFRLQGFPDLWHVKLKAIGISDTQLYKLAGNGVTTNVVQAIGNRLKMFIEK